MSGKHIELFLVDGTPGGLTTAEIIGWTGHVLRGERQQLADFLKREEATRNGAYILLGDDESAPGGVTAYIGRSENLADRFRKHAVKKDFWDRFVVITTKDETFTEGHWGYLEARLVELAREAERARLDNSNDPRGRRLTEAQSSDMETFLGQLQIVLPVLGINLIRGSARKTRQPPIAPTESVVFKLTDAKSGVHARAQVIDGEFTVLKVLPSCRRVDPNRPSRQHPTLVRQLPRTPRAAPLRRLGQSRGIPRHRDAGHSVRVALHRGRGVSRPFQ